MKNNEKPTCDIVGNRSYDSNLAMTYY